VVALGAARAAAAPPLRVGSKAFAESVILGEAAGLLAAAAGAPVEDRRALGGTRLCWDALVSGALDLYPEYTGTLREEILKGHGESDATSGDASGDLAALRKTLAARGLGLIGPLGFDNRYALAMREGEAARLGIRAISDLARHPELRIDLSNEFLRRRDGWPGLAARYALSEGRAQGLDHELAIRGLAAGALDVTDIYSTDAEIARDGLRVLTDDRGFFPRYQAILLYRRDAETRWPAAFAALARMAGQIDDATMMRLNGRSRSGRSPRTSSPSGSASGRPAPKRRAGRRSGVGRASTWRWSPCRCSRPSSVRCRSASWRRDDRASERSCWRRSASCRRSPRWRCWSS